MDCLERRPPPLAQPRQTSHPSFSATLLDAICRSLDSKAMTDIEGVGTTSSKLRQPDMQYQKKKAHSDHFWWATGKRKTAPPGYTSSDTSSYGFSSDAEMPPSKPVRVSRVQFTPPALPPRTPPQEKKKKSNPFRKRWRELRKGRASASSTSISAGARGGSPLSNFLKAIFSSSRTRKKNKNIMSIAATHEHSVAVPVIAPMTPPEEMEDIDMEAEAVKRRVEEILRDIEKHKEEGEEDDNDSDGSSDLFELENLTEIGTDELPVYCTTSLVANHPVICCK